MSTITNKVFIVQGSTKNKDELYFSPQQLKQQPSNHSTSDDSFMEFEATRRPSEKKEESLENSLIKSPKQISQLPPRFSKKMTNFPNGNPVKRFFDDDLNLQFSCDPQKFLGKIASFDNQYTIKRQFIDTTTSGIKIYHSHFIPSKDQSIKATLLVVHGFCEHSGLYINFADYYARRGYEVHLYDQRGFGYTGGISRHSSVQEFCEDFTTIMSLTNHEIPLYVYAHSTGALEVLTYLITYPETKIAGLVTLNAFLKVPNHYGVSLHKKWLSRFLLLFYEDMLVNSKINLSALCQNSYHIRKIIKDDHISAHLTLRMAVAIMDMCSIVQKNSSKITVPIFILHGTEDVVSSKDNSFILYNQIGSTVKDLRFIDGAYHQPQFDTNSQDLFALIGTWLDSNPEKQIKIINKPISQSLKERNNKLFKKMIFAMVIFLIWVLKNKPFVFGLISRAKCLAVLYSILKLGKKNIFG